MTDKEKLEKGSVEEELNSLLKEYGILKSSYGKLNDGITGIYNALTFLARKIDSINKQSAT